MIVTDGGGRSALSYGLSLGGRMWDGAPPRSVRPRDNPLLSLCFYFFVSLFFYLVVASISDVYTISPPELCRKKRKKGENGGGGTLVESVRSEVDVIPDFVRRGVPSPQRELGS